LPSDGRYCIPDEDRPEIRCCSPGWESSSTRIEMLFLQLPNMIEPYLGGMKSHEIGGSSTRLGGDSLESMGRDPKDLGLFQSW
jgi:hypothetical protein